MAYICLFVDSLKSVHPRPGSERRQADPSDGEVAVEPRGEGEHKDQRPRSSLNLAGLRAAFSSHTKPGQESPASGGSKQKTLQSFFKGSEKAATRAQIQSPVKPLREATRSSPAGRSSLDAFRYGKTQDSDVEDSGKGSSLSESDSQTTATPESPRCDLEGPSPDEQPCIADVAASEQPLDWPRSEPEAQGTKTEPTASREGDTAPSPDSKRARTQESQDSVAGSSAGPEPTQRDQPRSSLSTVDAPVSLQKRTAPLPFCVQALARRLGRLHEQQRQMDSDRLKYRRFRAKISPGENQSAEDELRKEIR